MIESRLEEIRRRLLDLTRHNRLLNHRLGDSRSLQIDGAQPQEVYRQLIGESRPFQFSISGRSTPNPPSSLILHRPNNSRLKQFKHPRPTASSSRRSSRRQPRPGDLTSSCKPHSPPRSFRSASSILPGKPIAPCRNKAAIFCMSPSEWSSGATRTRPSEISRAPLVFIPVELRRKSVHARHILQSFDDEVLTNPCLAELCEREFKFALPNFDPAEDELGAYIQEATKSVETATAWRVLPEIHVGLFSFSKFLMYRDLDHRTWPDPDTLANHPLIQVMTGLASIPNRIAIPDVAQLDELVKPVESFQIVDADSSQQAAIMGARAGVSMVLGRAAGHREISDHHEHHCRMSRSVSNGPCFVSEKGGGVGSGQAPARAGETGRFRARAAQPPGQQARGP